MFILATSYYWLLHLCINYSLVEIIHYCYSMASQLFFLCKLRSNMQLLVNAYTFNHDYMPLYMYSPRTSTQLCQTMLAIKYKISCYPALKHTMFVITITVYAEITSAIPVLLCFTMFLLCFWQAFAI